MTNQEILKIFKKTGAFLQGHFELSSGLHSSGYLQCALILQDPKIAGKLCSLLGSKFKKDNPSVVVAPAVGGVIVSHEVARALGVKGIFTERKEGKMCLRRGFSLSKSDRVLVVEDVVTTGKSTKEVTDVVKSIGAHIIGVGCIVDRSNGKINFKTKFRSLTNIDIPTINPDECSLCKNKVPLVKPGSRNVNK